MSATYAGAKGKGNPLPASPLSPKGTSFGASGGGVVRPLSDAEKEAVAGRVLLVKAHLPEGFEFIKALHAEGLVDGLRCLVSVTVFDEVDHGAG